MRDASRGAGERLAVRRHQPRGERRGGLDRDLLAEHGAHRELERVVVARDAPAPDGHGPKAR